MSERSQEMPGMLDGLAAVTRRDLLLAWKRPGDVVNPLFFFAMVCTLFPLAVGPSAEQLTFSGPGVLWVAALLAMLISLNSLFLTDFDDGSLEQFLVSPQPLPLELPGGGRANICTKRDTYPDGREFVGIGIPPDIVVETSVSDVQEGRDPVLDRGIELLRAKLGRSGR